MEIPDNHLAFGNPAKVRRELKKEEILWKKDGSKAYTNLAYNCLENLKKCVPLEESNVQRNSLRCEMHYKPKHS